VDHAIVDFADSRQVLVQLLLERLACQHGAGAFRRHLASQQIQADGVRGKRVGLAVLFDLKTVLEIAQELVGGRQARVLAAGKQALVAQRKSANMVPPWRTHGSRPPWSRLQALHQKLDVANAARREFDIEPVLQAAPRRQLLADSLARFRRPPRRAEIQELW